MAKVTVNTVFFYPDAKNKDEEAELLESPVKKLTLDLDDKFILAIGPHIPNYIKAFQIYGAYGFEKNSEYILNNNIIKLLEGTGRQMTVRGVLCQLKLLERDKLQGDVTVNSSLSLAVEFCRRK